MLFRSISETGEVSLTPRGADLLASAHLIPDDPEPAASPTERPCSACNGTGEQALFVSTHTCDACQGSKVERSHVTVNTRLFIDRPKEVVITLPRPYPFGDISAGIEPPYVTYYTRLKMGEVE